jgi:amino acid transporter
MTMLILVTIFAALFAAMCATARIPYAAAADGRFFRVFARLHPSGRFPSFSVAFVGVASALACLLELDALITALVVIYVVIGALPVIGAVTALRRLRPDIARPFSSRAYPLPSVVAAAGWIAILLTSGVRLYRRRLHAAGYRRRGVSLAGNGGSGNGRSGPAGE